MTVEEEDTHRHIIREGVDFMVETLCLLIELLTNMVFLFVVFLLLDMPFVDFCTSFYRAMLCIRGTSHGPVSVRPSVRPSQVGVLLKRLNVRSRKQHRTIAQGL